MKTAAERTAAYRLRHPERSKASTALSRKRHPDANRRAAARVRARKQAWMRTQKATPCADCKSSYPYYVMQFDHVRDTKAFTISNEWASRTWKDLDAEMKKCDVVCANCHAARTHVKGNHA